MSAEAKHGARPELWVVAAWGLVVAEFALAIYLGLKRPGAGPVRAFLYGPPLLALAALLLGIAGALWSALRRPFVTPPRLLGFCALGFVVATATYPLPFPSYRSARPSRVEIHLPVAGEWTVAWAGDDELNFVMRTRPDRRYGFLLVAARDGLTRARPDDPLSALAFGQPVLAPCDGTVARVVDEYPDDGRSAPDDLGNHLVLEIAPDEYLFLAGLQRGSFAVAPGQPVSRGAPLARVGFSACSRITPEPHLSIHVQDTPDALDGQSIPFYFHDYWVGPEHVARGVPEGAGFFVGRPVTGQKLRSSP